MASSAKKFCGQVVGRGRPPNANSVRKTGPNLQPREPIDLVTGLQLVASWLQVAQNL
jgi:hypothetical protein